MKIRAVSTQRREGAEPRIDFAPPARKKKNRHEYQERLSPSLVYSCLFFFLRGPRPRPTKSMPHPPKRSAAFGSSEVRDGSCPFASRRLCAETDDSTPWVHRLAEWQRRGIGRSFRLKDRARMEIRAEFFNALNRTQLHNPDASNPLQTQRRNAQGVPTSGFGRINTGSVFGPARSGQIVSRLSW